MGKRTAQSDRTAKHFNTPRMEHKKSNPNYGQQG